MSDAIKAGDIMTAEVITVSPDDHVEKVARLLLDHNISGLPVVDGEGRLVGIVSEGDLVQQEKKVKGPIYTIILGSVIYLESSQRFLEDLKRSTALRVNELMTSKKLYTAGIDTGVEEVAAMMVEKGINRVPVVDENNKLLGIITRQDILKANYK